MIRGRQVAAVLGVVACFGSASRLFAEQAAPASAPVLSATAYPPVPTTAADIWLAPSTRATSSMLALGKAARLVADAKFAEAAPLVQKPTLASTPLADYQSYYAGIIALRLGRLDEARQVASALVQKNPSGYLTEGARRLAGEVAEAQRDFQAAATFYEALPQTSIAPDDAWMRVGRARQSAGDARGAAEAFAHVYYEFPLSDLAAAAGAQIDGLHAWQPLEAGSARYKFELGRAERLFGARRYAQARDGFAALSSAAGGDDRELTALRVAECDLYLKRYQLARDALAPWTSAARRRAEAQFFSLTATRELGERAEYERLSRALANAFPDESWAEDALNNLASHFIVTDHDEQADQTFRQLLQRFPDGRYSARARWKIGWSAYRTGRWAECADTFERAAAVSPRSDYRPSWIYWAARSREQLGDTSAADRLYGILVADYLNSYYGRLATTRLTARHVEPMTLAAAVNRSGAGEVVPAVSRPAETGIPTADLIRALVAAGLYDDAVNELQWAQKTSGDSPAVQASLGYVYSQKGDLRKGINAIKRALPQYLSAAGDELPPEVLQVLFPVAYWDLIRQDAPANGIDPYVLAALIAQESTFDAEIRSHANAIGLMQIVPATGRQYARRLRIPRYSVAKLSDPRVNMRIGTVYFADLVEHFGSVSYALASYNAGPAAVARWLAERPGIATDEFIDDIPYPETQNYVRKILGTAEDYRRLYGERGVRPPGGAPGSSPSSIAPIALLKSAPHKSAATKRTSPKKHRARH